MSNSFEIGGATVAMNVTNVAHAAVLVPGSIGSSLIVYNDVSSTGDVFIAFGASPGTVAVIPVDGAPAMGYPIAPGAAHDLTAPPGSYWSAITSGANTATVYLTPGEGV